MLYKELGRSGAAHNVGGFPNSQSIQMTLQVATHSQNTQKPQTHCKENHRLLSFIQKLLSVDSNFTLLAICGGRCPIHKQNADLYTKKLMYT